MAGTTWTQEMVWLLSHDLDYEGAKMRLNDRSPFIEFVQNLSKLNIQFGIKSPIRISVAGFHL